jgi:hypothetical protein
LFTIQNKKLKKSIFTLMLINEKERLKFDSLFAFRGGKLTAKDFPIDDGAVRNIFIQFVRIMENGEKFSLADVRGKAIGTLTKA